MANELNTDYSGFAWFYNRHWGRAVPGLFLGAVERLLLASIAPEARLLDLCCGTGQMAQRLTEQGYEVVGVDGSEDMLRHARENAPRVDLRRMDARALDFSECFDAAYSTFDSLNHLLSAEDLERAFQGVRNALRPGGLFLFDLNMAEAYLTRWAGRMAIDDEDGACFVRFSYDQAALLGRCDVTMFRPHGEECWRRSRVALYQRCHGDEEIRSALERSGLELMTTQDATRDLGMTGNAGRMFFLARRVA